MTARYSDKEGNTWPNTSLESGGRTGYEGQDFSKDSGNPEKSRILAGETSFIYHLPNDQS